MAVQIRPVPRIAPAVVEVTEQTASDLQDGYEYLVDRPNEILFASFDDEAEKDSFIAQGRTWALTTGREFRVISSKKAGPTGLRFWVGDPGTYPNAGPHKRGTKKAPAAEFVGAE